jgi:hypothetical protein
MNEPFLPLPLPSPPEHGIGPVLASALGALSRTARTLVRRFRRIDIREPLSRGDFPPACRQAPEPRLAAGSTERGNGKRSTRFPVLPPVEF